MKTKNILVLLLLASLFLLSGCAQTNQPNACTEEAKLCPDGTAVGRVGPNCEFAPCPNVTNCQNYSVDKCPSQCVVCPPCAVCSSISCQSEEFCKVIGFNRSWYAENQCVGMWGGNVTNLLCCGSVGDFPNTCLIGACGCSPSNSHEVKACDCGEGRCWDSNKFKCVNTSSYPDNATTTEAVNNVVTANNQFASDLYSQYKSQNGNLFFSPYSISTALAMTYEGARGQTAEEMQAVFHLPQDNNTRRLGFAGVYNEINKKDKEYNLSTANALWAQKDYKFLDVYFNLTATYYGGNVSNLDFVADTENSRVTINRWVEGQTNDKIKDIIPPGAINELTRLVITNAVYFKAKWYIPFLNDTTDQDFRVTPTKTVKVKMMSLNGDYVKTFDGESVPLRFNYAETNETQILELPYQGDDVSMLILLPKGDNLQGLEQSLTADKLDELKAMLSETELTGVYMPRFKFETKYFMVDTLKNMGIEKAFDPNEADFSGMDGTKNLYISNVIHQAFIEVNETGTEAAAATVVIMAMTAMPATPKPVFRADHPFIFIIQQRDTGNILFIGRVTSPTAS
ncbi:MAG: serpin family protein [Candidatus Micrarchaeota archaeon]|nr:serpin family protein [Candidatus Micrarchaeota archaeon]